MSDSNSSVAKVVGLVASLAAVGLVFLLMKTGSVEMNVPAWLLAVACYVLGALAVWGTTKSQKG